MVGLKLFFNISYRQSSGTFQMALLVSPTVTCWDDHAILNIEGKAYDVTHCILDELGDRGIEWDDKKEAFFQLNMDDGRKLVGYASNLQGFRTFLKQWRLMKRNLASEARETAKVAKESVRAQKEAAKELETNKKQNNSTLETTKALKALKELLEADILTQEEYEAKRQTLVNQL